MDATHPGTTSPEMTRDASPGILRILEDHRVTGAVVERIEGRVEKLTDPALMYVTEDTDSPHDSPSVHYRTGHANCDQGERGRDASGTVSFFHKGGGSDQVLDVSNKYVLRKDTAVDHQFKGSGAPRQYVRICGFRHFQRAINEIRAEGNKWATDGVGLAEDIARLEPTPRSKNAKNAEEEEEALEESSDQLRKLNKANDRLQEFRKEVRDWSDIVHRKLATLTMHRASQSTWTIAITPGTSLRHWSILWVTLSTWVRSVSTLFLKVCLT